MSRRSLGNVLLSFVFCIAAWNVFSCQADAQENKAEVEQILIKAIESYENDKALQNLDERSKYYVFLREGIRHSPVIQASQLLAEIGSDKSLKMALKVDDPTWQVFNLIAITKTESDNERDERASKSLNKSFELYKRLDSPDEAKKAQLLGHLYAAALGVDKDEKKVKQRFKTQGVALNGIEEETMKIETARYYVSIDKIDEAREILNGLPEGTFQQRRFDALMQQNEGAAAIATASEPDANYSADHFLIKWLNLNTQSKAKIGLIQKLKDDDLNKFSCYIVLTQHFAEQGDTGMAKEMLALAEKCANQHSEPKLKLANKMQLTIERAKLEGTPIAKALAEASLLTPEDPILKNNLIQALFEAGETDEATKLIGETNVNDSVRFKIASSLLSDDQVDKAIEISEQAKNPLAGPSILAMVADQHWDKKRPEKARELISKAIKVVDKVRSTNQWDPPEGMVSLSAKWRISAMLFRSAIKMGLDLKTFDLFENTTVPFYQVGFAFGANGKLEMLEDWVKKVEGKKGYEGVRSLSSLGSAVGFGTYKQEVH